MAASANRPSRSRLAIALAIAVGILSGPLVGKADAATSGTSLQAQIDATESGGTMTVRPGTYRESVVVRKPMTIVGDGATILGSEIWTDWRPTPDGWTSAAKVPDLGSGGECSEPRCAWPEQVFRDGAALLQVADRPASGEFAIDGERRVVLADDPSTAHIEVTVRPSWMTIEAPDVTVRGFTMRYAASPPQEGGLSVLPGSDRLLIADVTLSDAHGALVSFQGVADAELRDSDLSRGGQLAVHAGGDGTRNLRIVDNRMTDSNTEGFDSGWEAGALKATVAEGLVVEGNVVEGNDGPGIWCDINCRDVTIERNRIGHNTRSGILFEISDGATIRDNVVYDNGWGFSTWGWGAGILVSSSTATEVVGNTVARNADGISVISQARGRGYGDAVHDVTVDNNTVIDGGSGFLLAWLQDWDGHLFDSAAANRGTGNTFSSPASRRQPCQFEWDGCRSIEGFASTPGGATSRYLTTGEAQAALDRAGLSETPGPSPATTPPSVQAPPAEEAPQPRELAPSLVIAFGFVAAALLGAMLLLRRRRATGV